MELGWGFGRHTGVDLPEGNSGTVPTREWLYYFWKDNAHTGQNWCKYGRANGDYVQQIEYEDCRSGNIWTPGQAVNASIGQGYVTGTAKGTFAGFPLNQVCVAGKTGTAQVVGKLATSVFASFAPCNNPKYVVVMMIPNSGFGADVSGPAVRQIWDGIYGLQGHKAALHGGRLPGLPYINQAGQIVRGLP